jgi:hypothetical protein
MFVCIRIRKDESGSDDSLLGMRAHSLVVSTIATTAPVQVTGISLLCASLNTTLQGRETGLKALATRPRIEQQRNIIGSDFQGLDVIGLRRHGTEGLRQQPACWYKSRRQ